MWWNIEVLWCQFFQFIHGGRQKRLSDKRLNSKGKRGKYGSKNIETLQLSPSNKQKVRILLGLIRKDNYREGEKWPSSQENSWKKLRPGRHPTEAKKPRAQSHWKQKIWSASSSETATQRKWAKLQQGTASSAAGGWRSGVGTEQWKK